VEHTVYKFTLKFLASDDVPARDLIKDYIYMVTYNMPNGCVEVGNVQVAFWRGGCFAAYLDLIAKDYGVPQVSIMLTAEWIKQLYRESKNREFKIDAIVIHPRPDALGAVIKWDWVNDCPIVKVISTR
jgi:hypothetical protein